MHIENAVYKYHYHYQMLKNKILNDNYCVRSMNVDLWDYQDDVT